MKRLPRGLVVAVLIAGGVGTALLTVGHSARSARAQWLVYVKRGDVYSFNPASGRTIRLTRGHLAGRRYGAVGDLAVSPDETRVAFTGNMRRNGTGIFVGQIAADAHAVSVTPWRGQKGSITPLPMNPQWLDSSHIEYTADEMGSKPWGAVMEVDTSTGHVGPIDPDEIPGGEEMSAAPGMAGVMQPLVMTRRFAAFQRFDHSGGCFATSDLVRGIGKQRRILTHTPAKDEWPADLAPGGKVLAVRMWVSSGPHDGLCVTYGHTVTYRHELLLAAPQHRLPVIVRFAPFLSPRAARAPQRVDAAWSPDGTRIAYATPTGKLIIRSLRTGHEQVIAEHVEALDW